MSKEKQIEEMANTINEMDEPNAHYYGRNMKEHEAFADCFTIAKHLYNAGYRKMPENMGEFSDGYHTFNELYHHRAVLFSVICNMFPEKAWKSKLHDTGDMYDGMFIVGIETEQGQATYHYDIEPYWDMFKVKELDKAPKYDGHTPSDAIERIGNLKQSEGEWIVTDADSGSFGEYEPFIEFKCPNCKSVYGIESGQYDWEYGEPIPWVACPLCGAKMKGGE